MAIYDHKKFLDVEDIAEYLRDKGVCDLNILTENYDRYIFHDFMESLIFEDKITPVFTFVGFAYDLSDESNRQILTNKSKCKEAFIFSENMINAWLNDKRLELHGVSNPSLFERLNTDDYYQYKSFKSHTEYVLDVESNMAKLIFLVPKIELDNIFNQPTHTEQAKDTIIAEQAKLIAELRANQGAGVNQQNSHTNTALMALNDVIATHWQDPSNPPKQQFIQAWIMDNYPNIEPSKALWIDKIIRHQDRK